MRSFLTKAAVVAGGLLLCLSCSRPAKHSRPPVVIISVDTVRADHLPAYGYRGVETPALDALRKDAVLYENAYCHVPLTLPSHVTLMTGLLPFEHGVRDNIGFRLSPSHRTLAGILREKGYATGAAVSSFVLEGDRGLAAGFDLYDDDADPASPDGRPGDDTVEKLERWLDTSSDRPVFLFLHLFEPHSPYLPREPFGSRYAARPYDGEIAAADAVVGRFLRYLEKKDLYDPAVILFLSDHGEGLNDHGEDEHGVFLYREAIRVPLLLKLPGSKNAGKVVSTPVGLVDVVPTVAELVGLTVPEAARGVSLMRPSEEGRRLYGETLYPRLRLGWSDLASLTDERFQYIEAPRPELYDLVADPRQRRDLSRQAPPAFRSMRAELANLPRRALSAPEAATPEDLRKLASLGYISVATGTASGANLPDPKDNVETLKKYKKLFDLYYTKKHAEAVVAAREIVSENPRILSVWRIMSESLAHRGEVREAARALAEGIGHVGAGGEAEEVSQAYHQLALRWREAGNREESERILQVALAQNLATEEMKRDLAKDRLESGHLTEAIEILSPVSASSDVETLELLGVALARAGRGAEAREAFLRAIGTDPGRPSTLLHLGNLSLREKDAAAAKDWFEKALRVDPGSPATLTSLGLAQAELKDDAGARDSWTKALALDPKQYDALLNLAILAGRAGRYDEARTALERFVANAPRDRYGERIAEARRLLKALPSRTGMQNE